MAEARIQIILSDGKKAGETLKELGKDANRINKELKDLKPGTEQFIAKSKDLQQVNARLKEVKDQIHGTTQASDGLKSAFEEFIPFSGTFANMGRQMGVAKTGVGGLTGSFGILKGAIAATGIGLLVVLLGSLYTWFTKTEEGADKLKSVLYPLQVLFQKVTGIVAELGGKVFKQLGEAMNNPKQAIIDLGNAIKDNIIARIESFAVFGSALAKIFTGDFKEGFKELGNASIQLTTGVKDGIDKMQEAGENISALWKDAYADGQKLLEQENAIEDAEAALQISRAKLNVELSKQMEIARDVTKSDQERLAAAHRVSEIQDKLSADEENFLRLKLRRLKLEQDLDGILTDDEKLERAKLEAELIQLQADNIDKKKKASAIAHTLELEQTKEREAVIKNLETLRIEAMKEGLEKEIESINLQTEQKIEALVGSAEQIREQEKLLEEIRQMEIQAVRDKYAAEQAEKDKKAKDEQEKRDKKLADEQKKIAEDKANFEKMMDDTHRDLALESFGFATEVSGKLLKDEADARKVRKAGAILEIGINLQRELAANAAAAAANPLNATTFGAAGATQLAASNLRSIIRSAISAAKVIAFRRGGVLKGPSHENGGMPFTIDGRPGFEAEGEEILLSKGVYQNPTLRRVASTLNVLGGGRQFATGGPLTLSDRSPVSRGSVSSSGGASGIPVDFSPLVSRIDMLIEAQNQRIDRLQVINVATETEDVLKVVNQIRYEADL